MSALISLSVKQGRQVDVIGNSKIRTSFSSLKTFGDFKKWLQVLRYEHSRIAKQEIQKGLLEGFDKKYVRIVDKVVGAPEENVKPFGRIEYRERAPDFTILAKIYEEIQKRSPIVSGYYKKNNYVMINSKATFIRNFDTWLRNVAKKRSPLLENPNTEFIFFNAAEYARRLEFLGIKRLQKEPPKTPSKDSKVKKAIVPHPHGVYYSAYRVIKGARYRAYIKDVVYEELTGEYLPAESFAPGKRRTFVDKKKGAVNHNRSYLYPTIRFRLRLEGVLRGNQKGTK